MKLIKRTPDKTCDNLLPLAIVLTVLSMVTHWRWYWRYVRYGEVDR